MKRAMKLGLAIGLSLVAVTALARRADAQTTVILVRHAEKVDGPGDVALTDAGKARARRLADLLAAADISAVYTTPYNRTRDTGQPIAQALGLTLSETPVTAGATFAQGLAERILRDHKGRTVLVVGHSNTTPDVIKALGARAVPAIPDAEYDNLYVVRVDSGGKVSLIRAKY